MHTRTLGRSAVVVGFAVLALAGCTASPAPTADEPAAHGADRTPPQTQAVDTVSAEQLDEWNQAWTGCLRERGYAVPDSTPGPYVRLPGGVTPEDLNECSAHAVEQTDVAFTVDVAP